MGSEYVVINRYYDPTTDQFLSVDPMISQTDQPYVFTNDSPLNATDPLGLSISGTNGESCISLSACSNPSVQARNQTISNAASVYFWAGVAAALAFQKASEHSSMSQYTSNAGACSSGSCDGTRLAVPLSIGAVGAPLLVAAGMALPEDVGAIAVAEGSEAAGGGTVMSGESLTIRMSTTVMGISGGIADAPGCIHGSTEACVNGGLGFVSSFIGDPIPALSMGAPAAIDDLWNWATG
jgi:hypothetical protein